MPSELPRIADRFDPRPLFPQGEITEHFGQIIGPFVDAGKERLDRCCKLRLVVFDGDHPVALASEDPLIDRALAAHRVDRNERTGEVDLVQELRDRRDLVGLGLGSDLTQCEALLAGPDADDVAEAFSLVV